MTLFNFNYNCKISNWKIINDVVMGGLSHGVISINEVGYGVFSGKVSLENNGGFSMVQCHFDQKKVDAFSKVQIRLKGDGKTYQFRIKTNNQDNHSYISSFNTSKNWETIEILFSSMYPAFRGKKLDLQNYPGKQMETIAFLIGNKKEEYFKLEIESIKLV